MKRSVDENYHPDTFHEDVEAFVGMGMCRDSIGGPSWTASGGENNQLGGKPDGTDESGGRTGSTLDPPGVQCGMVSHC